MTTNRERAREIGSSISQHIAHLADCPGCLAIEKALNDAEQRTLTEAHEWLADTYGEDTAAAFATEFLTPQQRGA